MPGSMCGGPLTAAEQIAVSIVNRHLRRHDLLDLMAFTTSASARLTDEPMTPQGKARAMDEIPLHDAAMAARICRRRCSSWRRAG